MKRWAFFFAIRRGWSCHFQKCWTEKNGDCTLRVNMTRMCSETIRKTSIASGERETHFSLKIIGSHHSLSLSLSWRQHCIMRLNERAYTDFILNFCFLKKILGSTLYVKRHFVFRSPYTLSVFCYFLVSFEEKIGGGTLWSRSGLSERLFLFLFFLYVCVCVCMSVFY